MLSLRFISVTVCVCATTPLVIFPLECVAEEKKVSPVIDFKAGDVSKALMGCPDGKIQIELIDAAIQLFDAKTEAAIGEPLKHDNAELNNYRSFIVCWAFSPDGKLVATGSRCDLPHVASEGQICIWEVATGKRLAEYHGGRKREERIGNVMGVKFSRDGKTILFKAKKFQIDGA
jgi:WD40 repeat protein